MLINEKGNGW